MITSPQTSVTPNQELVKLTLMTSPAAEKIRRKSTIGSTGRPSLGYINGREVIGPLGPPLANLHTVLDGEAVQSPTSIGRTNLLEELTSFGEATAAEQEVGDLDRNMVEDNSSEATLVTTPQSADDTVMVDASLRDPSQVVLEDKENLTPTKQEHVGMQSS